MTLKQIIDFDTLSFDRICEKIRNGEHFSLARYGDGEFNAILGKQGANCDGHEYFPEMGEDLADTLQSNPEYYIGLHQSKVIQDETLDWLEDADLLDREFVSNAVFHCAVRDGLMQKFWDAVNDCFDVVIIGPDYLSSQTAVSGAFHIKISGENTYSYLPQIKSKLMSIRKKWGFENSIVLISASMTAPLIVDHLYQQYGNTATFIDFGSTFDPYCGIKSRSFHKAIN